MLEDLNKARALLPPFVKKLTQPYEMRCFYYQVIECLRQGLTVGLPAFFETGSPMQLTVGLVVCLFFLCLQVRLSPFLDDNDDFLMVVCQVEVFFSARLSNVQIPLRSDRSPRRSSNEDVAQRV